MGASTCAAGSMRMLNVASSPSTTGTDVGASDERQARPRFDNRARSERHALEVAVGAARLQPRLLEVPRDVFGRLAMLGAAGLAAFHAIVGQKGDVRPPARSAGAWVDDSGRTGEQHADEGDGQERSLHS